MCQIKSDLNKNIRIIDRDPKINQTYLRKRKARISSADSKTTDTIKIFTESQCNIHWHCDYFLNKNQIEQSVLCDKKMTAMEQNNDSILAHSNDQFNQNDTDQSTRTSYNMSSVHSETQFNRFIRGFHSHKTVGTTTTSHKHRTGKNMLSIKASDCLVVLVIFLMLSVDRVLAKPTSFSLDQQNMQRALEMEQKLREPCKGATVGSVNIVDILNSVKDKAINALEVVSKEMTAHLNTWHKDEDDHQVSHAIWAHKNEDWLYDVTRFEGRNLRINASILNSESVLSNEQKDYFTQIGGNLANNERNLVDALLNRDLGLQRILVALNKSLQLILLNKPREDFIKHRQITNAFENVNSNVSSLLCEIRTALVHLKVNVPIVSKEEIQEFFNKPAEHIYHYIVLRESYIQLKFLYETISLIVNGHNNKISK